MCGFLNIINLKSANNHYKNIFKEFKKINQRGPDSTKKVKAKNYTAMFHRLSIIDLKTRSNQPMFSSCKRYLLTFNGEIYNFVELKKYLMNKGLRFKTKSDSEVILNGFKKEGVQFVKKLRGMFAFTIWDNKEEKLYVFRDRLGQKPLFYFKGVAPKGVSTFDIYKGVIPFILIQITVVLSMLFFPEMYGLSPEAQPLW